MNDRTRAPDFRLRPVVLGLALTALATSGCSFINDHSDSYTTAEQSRPLKGLDGQPLPRQRPEMPVRDISGSGTLNAKVPEPPDMTAEILDENYVVESVNDQSWLLVNEVPGRIWPAVAAWMNESGLAVAQDSTQLGVMQSEIVNFSRRARSLVGLDEATADEPRMIVQVRLAPGVRRRTTEVQIRPVTVAGGADNLQPWQDEPMDQPLEENLLEKLSTFLQAREDSRSYSRAALAMGSEPRVSLLEATAERDQAIAIDLPFDRVWGEIRRLLDDGSIPVLDLDRSAGYFLVDGRAEDERRRGWMTRWFAGDEVAPEATSRILLSEEDGQVVITAERADGYNGSNYSHSLITRLYEHLY